MSRLYLRFHIALLGSLIVFAVLAGLFWHFGGGQAFGHSVFTVILALSLLALAVAIVAYPFVRRLTQHLERLQLGVESLGAGDLSARVPVEGNDEVARLAHSFNRAAAQESPLRLLAPVKIYFQTPYLCTFLKLGKNLSHHSWCF